MGGLLDLKVALRSIKPCKSNKKKVIAQLVPTSEAGIPGSRWGGSTFMTFNALTYKVESQGHRICHMFYL